MVKTYLRYVNAASFGVVVSSGWSTVLAVTLLLLLLLLLLLTSVVLDIVVQRCSSIGLESLPLPPLWNR